MYTFVYSCWYILFFSVYCFRIFYSGYVIYKQKNIKQANNVVKISSNIFFFSLSLKIREMLGLKNTDIVTLKINLNRVLKDNYAFRSVYDTRATVPFLL